MIATLAGPIVQFISIPLYLWTSAHKVRVIAISICDLGAKISAGEIAIVGWECIGLDLLLFGEPVGIGNSTELMLLRNESATIEVLE